MQRAVAEPALPSGRFPLQLHLTDPGPEEGHHEGEGARAAPLRIAALAEDHFAGLHAVDQRPHHQAAGSGGCLGAEDDGEIGFRRDVDYRRHVRNVRVGRVRFSMSGPLGATATASRSRPTLGEPE